MKYPLKLLVYLVFFTITCISTQAQKQGNFWYFGNKAGLDFNTDPPTPLSNGMLNTTEGCATISNENGNLLFYTDGIKVYNKNHGVMSNGNNLTGDPSSSQSGIIVPDPGNPNRYYVFTVSAYSNSSLSYSIVDLTLDNGLGNVTSTKNVSILNGTEETVASVFANNFYWIIAHKRGTNNYYAYKLTSSGLDIANPVITSIGHTTPANGDIGHIKSDVTGNKLAQTFYFGGVTELYDFNRVTGVLSNTKRLTVSSAYGVEFSPNGKLLYVHGFGTGTYQFNLEAGSGSATDIQNSRVTLSSGASEGAVQIAVNGKIYIANYGQSSLSVINNPNVVGTGCNYVKGGQSLGTQTSAIGLPNIISSFVSTGPPIISSPIATTVGNSTATIGATVNGDGGSPITERGFYYGTSASPSTNKTITTGTTGTFTSNITGLTPGTTYYFRAYAINANGTSFTVDETFTTESGPAIPVITAGFAINDNTQCATGNSFSFTNSSTTSSGTLSYTWTFGDGNTSTAKDPVHTYAAPGTYTVSLTATETGSSEEKTTTGSVEVYAVPASTFTINTAAQCLAGNSFSFANGSAISTGTMTYSWAFGDGATSTSKDPVHSFTAAGTYIVKLITTSNNGCTKESTQSLTVHPKPVVAFSINDNTQCAGRNSFVFTNTSSISAGTLSYTWDFGDGNTSTATNPTHAYASAGTYTVKLVAQSSSSCSEELTKEVNVYAEPTAAFTVNTAKQCLSENSFSFTNGSTISAGSMTYTWAFGDGSTSLAKDPVHEYATAGTYSVKLIITSDNGCSKEIMETVSVSPKPVAGFSINEARQCLTGNEFKFTNSSTISEGTLSQIWYFGDGSTSTDLNSQHHYTSAGTYQVKLVITSDNNCIDSIEQEIEVIEMPTGTITAADGLVICKGTTMPLTATGGSSYQWYLNGEAIEGATADLLNADKGGIYTAEIFNESGCSTMLESSLEMVLIEKPIVNFNFDSYCINKPVVFTNSSDNSKSGEVRYKWFIGNSEMGTERNMTHTFNQNGLQQIKLQVSPALCEDLVQEVSKDLTIESAPTAERYKVVDAVKGKDVVLKARNLDATITWLPGDNLSNSSSTSPTLKPAKEQDYKIKYQFESGCTTIDSQLVRIFDAENIFVPKAFTPNGDGRNDMLKPMLVGMRQINYFRVYNRWGNLVFESRTANAGWDGRFKGVLQPMETYVWVVEGITDGGKTIRSSGNTTLIR
jgi:gliding motility-associated-like protein